MLIAMAGSFVPLMWALVLMFVIMYSFSIILMQFLASHFSMPALDEGRRLSQPAFASEELQEKAYARRLFKTSTTVFSWSTSYSDLEACNQLYGTLGACLATLFRSIIGAEFSNAADALAKVHWALAGAYIIYVAGMIFGVLNVLTGIFCDAAMQAATTDRENVLAAIQEDDATFVDELHELFHKVDTDASGKVTLEEFENTLGDPSVKAHLESIGISVAEASGLIQLLDGDGSGEVDVEEFVSGCVRIHGGAKELDMMTLLYENKKVILRLKDIQDSLAALKVNAFRSASDISQWHTAQMCR